MGLLPTREPRFPGPGAPFGAPSLRRTRSSSERRYLYLFRPFSPLSPPGRRLPSRVRSPTQIASNRQNSTLSTGPRTEAGKIASSKNAISHGLSGADPVLAYENRADYEKLVEDYTNEYEPDTIHQTFLVSQLAGARWRLNRIQRIENAALDLIIAGPGELTDTPDHKIAQRMLDSGGDPLPRLERYRASIERSYHRAVKELRMAQKQQIQDEARLRPFQTRQMKEYIHAAANAPIPGYEDL